MYYDFLKREILRGKNINHPLEEIEWCQIGGTNVKVGTIPKWGYIKSWGKGCDSPTNPLVESPNQLGNWRAKSIGCTRAHCME